MIGLALRLAQVVLGALFVVLFWGIIAPLRARSVPDVEFQAPPTPERSVAAFNRYAVIGSRNLFQTPEDAPLSAPIEEVIAESRLQYRVVGTVATGGAETSYALLEDSRKKVSVYGVGANLDGGAEIERIERRRVVLLNAGRREALEMRAQETPPSLALLQSGREAKADYRVNAPEPPAYVATSSLALLTRVAQRFAAEPPSPRPPAPPRPSVDMAQRELPTERDPLRSTLGIGAGPSPNAYTAFAGPVRATSSAFEAVAGQPLLVGLRQKLALREGEQILAVNGIPIEPADRLPELLRSLVRSGPARVRIAVDSSTEREIEVTLP